MNNTQSISDKIFLYIKEYIEREKFAPSQVEIKEQFNRTLSSIQYQLKKLEQQKKIERVKGKGRSIRLLDND
jgi:SOS-response transcriptional repressor LexA